MVIVYRLLALACLALAQAVAEYHWPAPVAPGAATMVGPAESAPGTVWGQVLLSVGGVPKNNPKIKLICLSNPSQPILWTYVGPDGDYVFASVPPGVYAVTCKYSAPEGGLYYGERKPAIVPPGGETKAVVWLE